MTKWLRAVVLVGIIRPAVARDFSDFDLRIPLPIVAQDGNWTTGQFDWRDAGEGSDLRFALRPGKYRRLVVTLYDSQDAEHTNDTLTVSLNGRELGVFHRGATNGWTTWPAVIPTDTVGPGEQRLHFVRHGKPIAISEVHITGSVVKPPPPCGGLQQAGWNRRADHFMYAPTLYATMMPAARQYALTVCSSDGSVQRRVTASKPEIDLASVWADLPATWPYTAWIEALDGRGTIIGRTSGIEFLRVGEFRGPYRPARCGYIESGSKGAEYVMNALGGWQPPRAEPFPALFYSQFIRVLLTYAQLHPNTPRASQALDLANRFGKQLINRTCPPEWTYGGMPRSHDDARFTTDRNTMLQVHRTAMVGKAYIDLLVATGQAAYRDAAMKIGDRLKATQLPEGRWYWRVDPKTGAPYVDGGGTTNDYTSDQAEIIDFLDELATHHHRQDLIPARDRAVKWMLDHPVKTHCWQHQWDDTASFQPYENLEFYDTALFAMYLARHATWRNGYRAIAEGLFRWIEDQFVLWENSYDPKFITPGVLEQYAYRFTIDWHSAHYIRLCLALHQATGQQIYLKKARAMADTLTVVQRADGAYPTYLRQTAPGPDANTLGPIDYGDPWPNDNAYDGETLMKLGQYLGEAKTK